MITKDLREIAVSGIEVLNRASKLLLERASTVGSIRAKSNSRDIVTDTDILVETFLIEEFKKLTPGADFVSEETNAKELKSPAKWIIDPIDGTRYYAEGFSFYAISAAYAINDIPQIGIITLPKDNKVFCAIREQGLYINGKLTVLPSRKLKIEESICYIDMDKIDTLQPKEKTWISSTLTKLLSRTYRVRMFGVSSIAYCWMCLGLIDAFIDITGLNPSWDSMAGALILKEAGAICSQVKAIEGAPRFVATIPSLWMDYWNLINPGGENAQQGLQYR